MSTEREWIKASRSAGNGECVEVARTSGVTLIRDSKNPENGHLAVTPQAFGDLLEFARRHG